MYCKKNYINNIIFNHLIKLLFLIYKILDYFKLSINDKNR